MSNAIKLNLWLPDSYRKEYVIVYKRLLKTYEKISQKVFSSIEKSTEEYGNMLVKEYNTMYNCEFINPEDIFENINYEKADFYEMEKLMEYNFKLSSLSTAYQLFEQQLRKFMYEEIDHAYNPIEREAFVKFGTNMRKIKELYKYVGYELSSDKYWSDIEELINIVNTFKHGKGHSSEKLYAKNPDFFLNAGFSNKKLIDQELTSNAAIVLDIERIDVEHYINILIHFWEDFPKHVYAIYEIAEKA